MSVATKYQSGWKNEGTYGTGVTVDRFGEITKDGLVPQYGRIESKGIRAGTGVQRTAGFAPYVLGAAGPIEMEVPTKGWGWWLQHILGSVATTGPTTGRYQHLATLGTPGKFTFQRNAPFFSSDTNQAMTFEGCKVTACEFSNSVEGLLMFNATLDCEDYNSSTGLATASYPTGIELFSFVGGTVTIAGSAVNVTDIKVSIDAGLDLSRRYIRGSALKLEPIRIGMPQITWSMTLDWEDLTQVNRVASATASGALAAIDAKWVGPTLISGSVFPELEIVMQNARFDGGFPTVDGPVRLTTPLSGIVMDDQTNPPISIAYRSTDVTP